MANTLNLVIVSAEKRIFSGEVASVSVSAAEGEIGILPGHVPLLTKIKPGQVAFFDTDGKEEHIYISGGFLEIQPKTVNILADVAERGEDLDRDRILQAKEKLEKKLKQTSVTDKQFSELSVKLSRELAKLKAFELANSAESLKSKSKF